MRTQEVNIQLQKSAKEIAEAVAFARVQAFRWYQCEPSDIPQHIFAARVETQIVATVGITTSGIRPLPVRQLYQLAAAHYPPNWNWQSVIQLSWFFSNIKGCFMLLLLVALHHCYCLGKRYAILQMKEVVSSMLSEKGLQLSLLHDVRLRMDKIKEAEFGYYHDGSPVHLYYLEIKTNLHSVRNYVLQNQSKMHCHTVMLSHGI